MFQRRSILLAVLCALVNGWVTPANAEGNDESKAGEVQSAVQFDDVLVTGEVPGPSLWKVTHGEHTLWILGTVQPLPKKLKWQAKHVAALIAQSQEVITAGKTDVDVDVGVLETMKSIPNIFRMQRNPDGATLVDVLEPDVYAKWRLLKRKYLGGSDYAERLRPLFAARRLQEQALEESGLSSDSAIWPAVRKAARKHDVKITAPDVELEVKIEHASDMMKDMVTIPIDDRDCFRTTIDQLEADLATKKTRANAWAVGDLEALTQLYRAPQSLSCQQVLRRAMANHEGSTSKYSAQEFAIKAQAENDQARAEVERRWLVAVTAALTNNVTTFAMLPIYDLVNPKGRLQLLREKGYVVEAPTQ